VVLQKKADEREQALFEALERKNRALRSREAALRRSRNICSQSSARDAAQLEYKVVTISDAPSGHAHGLHEATLATSCRIFGDGSVK